MFDGNTNLVKLSMSKNRISHIANGTFPDLRRVTTLRLDHNHIKGMELQALRGLPALEELDLSYNLLDHVHAAWFDPLPRLQTLRLEHNKVATFGTPLVKLAVRRALAVSLAGNPVRCECGPVHDAWQSAHAARLTLDVTCAHGQPWSQALATLECGAEAAEAEAAAEAEVAAEAAAAAVAAAVVARSAPEPGHAPILAASVVY
ncbi:Toll-like receptor 6, partial [Gryllus bimaculatus]